MTSVPWKLWEGQVVDGCFPLRRYLGGTDHSAVFLTQYGDPDPRNAAIKLVLVGPNSELLSQWERAAQLSHPNLLRLLRTGSCRVNQLALDYVMTEGKKGSDVQRYKGLGEMNAEQLWETTLDDNARTLLQVKVEHADDADDLFAKLMGDVVEPRREFIQENALSVANLDV